MTDLELTYSELIKIPSFGDRLNYLNLKDKPFLSPRAIQMDNRFYMDRAWLDVRNEVIRRDGGFDLGVFGDYISGSILVHHMNPITPEDFDNWNVEKLLNPENLISVSYDTHNKIHYGKPKEEYQPRTSGDTKLW